MSKNSICLNMIVKNEEHVIINTLTNLCSNIIFDYWVICDTGSSDNTKKLITSFFKERDIKGELFEHEWKDFGHNRTLALECAYNKTDMLFIFDADDEIVGKLVLPNKIISDSYTFKFGCGFVYIRTLLINNRKKWGFKGVLHEYLINLEPLDNDNKKHIEGDYYIVSGRTGNRSKNPNKYIDDANILKKAHYEILNTDYNLSCRYAFYCAQSFKDSGEKYINDAIEWYKKCLTLNMWSQEQYVSCLTIGDLYFRQNDMTNALKYWYKTIEYDSERIEGIINAMQYLLVNGENLLINALYHKFKNYNKKILDKLFINSNLYKDELEYYNSIAAYYVNDKMSGYDCCKQIFLNDELPYNLMRGCVSNFNFYINLFNKDTDTNKLQLFYSFDNLIHSTSLKYDNIEQNMINTWNTLFESCRLLLTKPSKFNLRKKKQISIFISFTTCKRLDLFKETIFSMLNHWNDIDKIDYWFCVDDNSSNEDRLAMKTLFPWIKFYMKTKEEKGHRGSMNIIYKKLIELNPTYWIHMEDDFLFHKKHNYIDNSITLLNSKYCRDNNVKQILFNRNYGEIIANYNIKGHISNSTNNNIVFHKHCNGNFNYVNCHYWPHYSFRPSLIDVKTILGLGNFDSDNTFFELDYAKKWETSGYTSAFFNRITCRHIGRLTSDRNTKVVKNAYDLNNEEQFYEKTNIKSKNRIKIVNLERREDRKEETIRKLLEAGIKTEDYDFIKAVDGNTIKPTLKIKHLFRNNDFGSRRGVIGCALSHYNLWNQLLNDSDNEYYIIMEDDFTLCKNFKQQFEILETNNEFSKRDVLFLGYHMFEKNRQTHFQLYNIESNSVDVEPLDCKLYIGGYFAYSINKNGAKILIDYIEKNGINHGIDYLNKIIPNLNSYECRPQIVFSEWNENGKQIDSDIQNIYDSIDFKNIVDEIDEMKEKYVFIPNLDQHGNDIYYYNQSLEDNFLISEKDTNCIGFNTLGFFKNKIVINDLKPSIYFKEGDGIYIKKSFYKDYINKKQIEINPIDKNYIRIKMLCNWCSSEQLCKEWSNMCEAGFKWKNYQLVWTDVKEDIDYYVIINSPPKDSYFDPKRTIVFQMEPWVNDPNKNWGVKTWGKWAEPNPNDFLAVRGRKTECHNNAFWQLELKLDDFQKTELFEKTKDKIISSICSSKYFDEGHIARIDFLKFLEEKGNIQLDIYSQDNTHCFTNYIGPLSPYIDKSKGFNQYKYYFMIENNYETNFMTEKLWEPILCETLVFYYGCPNITDYIDPMAFVQLDITDFEKSYQVIKQAINEDWWSQRINIIRQEKHRILNELSFFPTIDKIIAQNIQNSYIDLYNKYFSGYNFNIDLQINTKKYCFIHSCHLKEIGTSILNDIISKLIDSNSIQHFENVFIVNIGERLNPNDFQNNKIQIINYSENTQLFEIPTINLIHAFCEYNDNCEILYLHTKGISYPNSKNVIDWKNMMIHFLVNNCKDCFELLKQYDTVGCNYLETPFKHYSGNFWWATSNYIKKLNRIPNESKRHEAEWWILSNKMVKHYEIHHSGINHYETDYPKEKYIILDKSIHIYSVFHSYFYDELYSDIENEDDNKKITLYGVKQIQKNTTKLNMIYEADFKIYNPNFQKMKYNEGSALYHLYKNGLYKKYNYIGLCQYDMKFFSNTIKDISNVINNTTLDCIFNIGYFPDIKATGFRGAHGLIVNKINNLSSGLETYNKFFKTNYASEHVIKNLLIYCNTFVIPSKMFENMMAWMEQYFIDDLILDKSNSDCDNPGCVPEALVGMFLSLEVYKGAKYYPFHIKHIWPLYKNKSY